jgi:GTP-binding protein HflX
VLDEIGAGDRPVLNVYNKADRLTPEEARRLQQDDPESAVISAARGDGLDGLLAAIARRLPEPWIRLRVRLPYSEGRLLARIHAEGRVLSERYVASGITLEAEVPGMLAVQLRALKRPERSRRAAS